MSKFISVGFLVGASTLISPSLEAVTLKRKKCQNSSAKLAKLGNRDTYQAAKPSVHRGDPTTVSAAHSINHLQFTRWLVAVQGAEKTAVTSKASSVVSTRCRLPPLSPTQRQLPCQLMQMGKWLPGRGTCMHTGGESSTKSLGVENLFQLFASNSVVYRQCLIL